MKFVYASLSLALIASATAASLAAPAAEPAEGHDHDHSARSAQRQKNRAMNRAATPTERQLQARIYKAIDALSAQADEYWHSGNYEGLAFCNRMITQLDPQDLLAWSDLGWILWAGLNQEAEAEKVLRAAVAANPKRHDMYYDLGFYLYRRKRYHEAASTLTKATSFPDADAITWNLYAHALEKMGCPERAAEVWRTMQTRFKNGPNPQVNLDRMKRRGLIK